MTGSNVPTDDALTHWPKVRHLLGRTTSEDVYEPGCRCGWTGERIIAGEDHSMSWDRAWDVADQHYRDVPSGPVGASP